MVLINEDLAILFDNASEHASALGHKDVSTIHFLWALYSADPAEVPAAEAVTSQLSEFGHVDKETVINKIDMELEAMEVSTSNALGKVPTSSELQQILEISERLSDDGWVSLPGLVRGMIVQEDNAAIHLLLSCSPDDEDTDMEPDEDDENQFPVKMMTYGTGQSSTSIISSLTSPTQLGQIPEGDGIEVAPKSTIITSVFNAKIKFKSALKARNRGDRNIKQGVSFNKVVSGVSYNESFVPNHGKLEEKRELVSQSSNLNRKKSSSSLRSSRRKSLRGVLRIREDTLKHLTALKEEEDEMNDPLGDVFMNDRKRDTTYVLADDTDTRSLRYYELKNLASDRTFYELGPDGAIQVTDKDIGQFARSGFMKAHKDVLEGAMKDVKKKSKDWNDEVGIIGGAWRSIVKRIILISNDKVNALRYSRGMHAFVPFLTGYEAYILDLVIDAFDSREKNRLAKTLRTAFRNRNISRILIQQFSRFDVVWHWHTQFAHNRSFDAWGQVPIFGITGFPATENFPSTRAHALNSIYRIILGQGFWWTRAITGREGLVTDDQNAAAQNLAAESNGFELANRNQFGTHYGRQRTNEFRLHHRLPVDESTVRTFVAAPAATLLNNGVEHVLRQLAKHWRNMLYQPSGNFAHQRMEQLNPFETLRFHLPAVLVQLTALRGINKWDSVVLAPFVRKLQLIEPMDKVSPICELVRECKEKIAVNVCGGIASRVDPLISWLETINEALLEIYHESEEVLEVIQSVELGLRLGHNLISQTNWKVPNSSVLEKAIINCIRGKETRDIELPLIKRAVTLIPPRDKRFLFELWQKGFKHTNAARLLLGRAKTLLKRELRRDALDKCIQNLSRGEVIKSYENGVRYIIEDKSGSSGVYIYDGDDNHQGPTFKFRHDRTYTTRIIGDADSVEIRLYIPVAESITRAQRASMTIELHHGKKFSFDAFMEFTYLRFSLRQLLVIGQLQCPELDDARLAVLSDIQRSKKVEVPLKNLIPGQKYYVYENKSYVPFMCTKRYSPEDSEWEKYARKRIVKVPPQSMIVIGGGPTGLLTTLHCLESVLFTNGEMNLLESRDAFTKGGSTFERAQIVRLDARWIAKLRYHLGTGYEDVFIPASGETDSHLGNTLPTQGFVEITIKDLENMLHVEVSKLLSKGLIKHSTNAGAQYDVDTNTLSKRGKALKLNDLVKRKVDPNGQYSKTYFTWKVVKINFAQEVEVRDLKLGEEYMIYTELGGKLYPYQLVGQNIHTNEVEFLALQDGKENIKRSMASLPTIYPKETTGHSTTLSICFECIHKSDKNVYCREEFQFEDIENQTFAIDVGHTHVVEAIGKPHGSKVHFSATTYEPYGVCCISGLKVSLGMHRFGNTRWGKGIIDDIRSHQDQNTRIIGDFTKTVKSSRIASKMLDMITKPAKNNNWQLHFDKLVSDAGYSPQMGMESYESIVKKLQVALAQYSKSALEYKRQYLQTRFFETGDNYYLGMEFTREYDTWKNATVDDLISPLKRALDMSSDGDKKKLRRFRGTLAHHIDRLWFDSTLETIRLGDVYNPGARGKVPTLYLIDSLIDQKLGSLPVGEAFRLRDNPEERYEVYRKVFNKVTVRNVEGQISNMPSNAIVRRGGNLTRGPDGNAESKVALATFPVGHYVNFRTMRLNDEDKGYTFAFIGDEQSTPHFMRYSGLTGACVNSMLFNNFIEQAIKGDKFSERFKLYSQETNWSNGEVVQRGTGGNYGQDGFLRPGFSYSHGIDYLHSKVIEYKESGQDLDHVLSRDWKIKFAASLVPRGLELHDGFKYVLVDFLQRAIFDKFISELEKYDEMDSDTITTLKDKYVLMETKRNDLSPGEYWEEFVDGINLNPLAETSFQFQVLIAHRLEIIVNDVIEFSAEAYSGNTRVSSEMFNQPKSVDSIVDDFAVEAQNFANGLTQNASFAAAALASQFITRVGSPILSGFTILIALGTITNVSRYKIRNELFREEFYDTRFVHVLKAVFQHMSYHDRNMVPNEDNPFFRILESQKDTLLWHIKYYNYPEPEEFKTAYADFIADINSEEALKTFTELMTTKFIPDIYHVNSYVQEFLVDIYKTLDEMRRLREMASSSLNSDVSTMKANVLFHRLLLFGPRVERTLQRGVVRFGFVKSRRLRHQHIMALLMYLWSKLYWARTSERSLPTTVQKAKQASGSFIKPVSAEAIQIVAQLTSLSKQIGPSALQREIQDVRSLYHATRESYVSSVLIISGWLSFLTAIVFTVGNIGNITVLLRGASWSFGIITPIGAVLSMLFLWRKLLHLIKLSFSLGRKIRTAKGKGIVHLRKVRSLTRKQEFITLMRIVASGGASASLPWALIARENLIDNVNQDYPLWVALGSLGLHVLSTFFLFLIEYSSRYNLDSKLGEYVCEAFKDEIEKKREQFYVPFNDIDTRQVQERMLWEYVARDFLHHYRFDTVFASNRFGSILQYIQSGTNQRQDEMMGGNKV